MIVALTFVLTGNFNTLKCYKKTVILSKSCCCKRISVEIDIGKVYGSNRLDSGIKNFNGRLFNSVYAPVYVFSTGNLNGHTNLDIIHGSFCDIVYVVTALATFILKVKLVKVPAISLGDYTCYDTLNDNSLIIGKLYV